MPSRSRTALARVTFALALAALVAAISGAPSLLGAARVGAAGIPIVDSCEEPNYLDRTAPAADREFNWDYSFAGDPERCITIRAGQRVRWVGGFSGHPLDPDEGTTPNPIVSHADETGFVEYAFTQPGVYGYRCNYHFSMRGAIQVLPALPAAAVPWGGTAALAVLACVLAAVGWRLPARRAARPRARDAETMSSYARRPRTRRHRWRV
jgi:hypothetical protein